MKTILRIGIFLLATTLAWGQTNSLTGLLQQGLFEEQANRNLEAAIADYQNLAAQFDKDRQLAATAVFRLGECYRAQGHTNEAAAQYQRIIHEFSDQQTLATLSRQNLAGMGLTGRSTAVEPTAVESPDTQLWNKLKDMPPDQLAKVLPTLVPDATLDSLMQQRNDAQAKMAQIELDYARSNIVYVRQEALLKEIYQQTDDRIAGIMQALKLKAEMPQRGSFQTRLQSIVNRAANTAQASESENVTTDEEAHEIQRLQQLIQNSPDLINSHGSGSFTLVNAAFKGWLKVVAYLLDHEVDVNAPCQGVPGAMSELNDPNGQRVTPLYAAVGVGNKAMTQLLIDRGADVRFKGPQGNTALHLATKRGYQAVTEVLLASHAEVNALNDAGTTPLFSAVESGQVKIVQMLLAAGATVNLKDGQGRTVLNYAVGTSLEMVKTLLDAHTNPNTEDKQGRTPLSYETERGSTEGIKLFLTAKADANGGSVDSPLLCAVHAKNVASTELLLQAGANPNVDGRADGIVTIVGNTDCAGGKSSITPLRLAVEMDQLPMVQLLLKFKADPDDTHEGDRPLLFSALSHAYTNLFAALLEVGANVESHDPTFSNNGDRPDWTPLAAAVWQQSPMAVELLLQHGANPNALDTVGNVPLHWAVSFLRGRMTEDNFKMVELLLDHGTDPNVRNAAGYLPLDYVKMWLSQNDSGDKLNATKIAALLRQHGALDKLPAWDAITISRPSANFSYAIFHKGTNDWNQFTLLEAIVNFYNSSGNYSVSLGNNSWTGYPLNSMLPFPDLTRVAIVRPGRNSTNQTRLVLNVLNQTNGIDFSKDMPLVFGDVVEIPERDHPLGDNSAGLVGNQLETLADYEKGSVRLEVKDQHVDIPMYRLGGSALLTTILEKSEARRLLLTSSDLSRVKVTRRDSKTGKSREWILDCSPPQTTANGNGAFTVGSGNLSLSSASPLAYQWYNGGNNSSSEGNGNDLWLRDGDVISVPEKR